MPALADLLHACVLDPFAPSSILRAKAQADFFLATRRCYTFFYHDISYTSRQFACQCREGGGDADGGGGEGGGGEGGGDEGGGEGGGLNILTPSPLYLCEQK